MSSVLKAPNMDGSPTVAARLLANELRRLRLAADLSQSDVASELGCSTARIGHFETRRNQARRSDLISMLLMYGVPRERHDWYLDLAMKARDKGWWDGDPGIPEWFSAFVGLEWGATEVWNFEQGVIPGLLQTSAYMEAMHKSDKTRSDAMAQTFQDQRLRRQRALDRAEQPLTLHAILDEAPLHRMIGSYTVMREQYKRLIALSEHPQVTIQVLPFVAGFHRSMEGSFHWLGFTAVDDPGIVYVETKRGGLYMEEQEEIELYLGIFKSLASTALSPAKSVSMIRKLLKELT